MERKGISQEGLKVIACLTMLVDHVGAVFLPSVLWPRLIGRIAFPLYCFLLAEGAFYTKNPKRYGLRLGAGMVLSELPFDLALFGAVTVSYQNVMVTLLLGYLAICAMKKGSNTLVKLFIALPFAIGAQLLRADYGGLGVMLIVMFSLVRTMPHSLLWQSIGLAFICTQFGWVEWPAMLAMIPIGFYHGRKQTTGKAVQWSFYLFYPVHLTVLWLIAM